LVALGQYYRDVGGDVLARKMVARIKTPVLSLKDNPDIAPSYELAPGIRRLVVAKGAFLVFYRVRVDVEVLHIRRAERDSATGDELGQSRPTRNKPSALKALYVCYLTLSLPTAYPR
jgi:plasmid stabilization system protein ParE